MNFKEKQNFFNFKKLFFALVLFLTLFSSTSLFPTKVYSENWDADTPESLAALSEAAPVVDDGICGITQIGNCIEQIEYEIMILISKIMGLTVSLFNAVFEYTVLKITDTINNLPVLNVIWKTFRDVANISFIFIILFLAINTIIGKNEHGVKHALSKVIFIAVLINFSMFFTKVVIDTSNILSLQFYTKINNGEAGRGISDTIMSSFQFQKFYQNPEDQARAAQAYLEKVQNAQSYSSASPLGPLITGVILFFTNKPGAAAAFASSPNAGTTFVMGSITMFIVAIVFLAASIVFIKRMTKLILLIVSSSIAFAGGLTHKTEGMAHQWWETLLKEAFYAPIFMGMMWITILIMSSVDFKSAVAKPEGNEWIASGTLISYIFIINLFILALAMGEKLGIKSAEGSMKSFGWLKNNLGARPFNSAFRNTLGRFGFNQLEAKEGSIAHRFQGWRMRAANGDAWGGGVVGGKLAQIIAPQFDKGFKALAHGKLGENMNSAHEELEERKENLMRYKAEYRSHPEMYAKILLEQTVKGLKKGALEKEVADSAWAESKDPKERANLLAYMNEMVEKETDTGKKKDLKDAFDRLDKGRFSGEENDAHDRVRRDQSMQFHRNKFDELTNGTIDNHGNRDTSKALAKYQEYKDLFEKGGLLERERVLIKKQVDGNITSAEQTQLDTLKTEIKGKKEMLNKTNEGIALKDFVGSLNTVQHTGLNIKDQVMHPLTLDQITGKTIGKLASSGQMSTEDAQKLVDEVMTPRITRLQNYIEAQSKGDSNARTAMLDSVNKHLTNLGQAILNSEDDALDYYEKTLMNADSSVASAERNFNREHGTGFGGEGETISKNATKAKDASRVRPAAGNPPPPPPPPPPARPNPLGNTSPTNPII